MLCFILIVNYFLKILFSQHLWSVKTIYYLLFNSSFGKKSKKKNIICFDKDYCM